MKLILWLLLGSLLVSDGPCDLATVEPVLVCDVCREINPAIDGQGLHCGAPPRSAEVCLKAAYHCPKCGRMQRTPERCCGAAPPERHEFRSLIVLRCEDCGRSGEMEGPCPNPECAQSGRRIRRVCENSGTFPHSTDVEVRP